MRHAVCRLEDARMSFQKADMANHPLIHLGGNMLGPVSLAGAVMPFWPWNVS